jgi:hypothetical protein
LLRLQLGFGSAAICPHTQSADMSAHSKLRPRIGTGLSQNGTAARRL